MKKPFLFCLVLVVFFHRASSQVQLTQYFLDKTLYNPAYTGSGGSVCANAYLRDQWLGLTDQDGNKVAPLSGILNFSTPISQSNSGLGINMLFDRIGFEQALGFKLNYAYFITLPDKKSRISVGIGVSVLNNVIKFNRYILEQTGDPLIQDTNHSSGTIVPDLDFGIQYQYLKKFNIGFSAINILESYTRIGNVRYSKKQNFYFTSEYYIQLFKSREAEICLVPSTLIKTNMVNMQIDMNARIEYNNMMWAGASWRYQDAVAVMAGVNIRRVRAGLSYDITTSYLSKVSHGSIEFFAGYCFPLKRKAEQVCYINPRYKQRQK